MIDELLKIIGQKDWVETALASLALLSAVRSTYDSVRRLATFGVSSLRSFRAEVAKRAELCRTKTGYVGALLARYTAIITLNLLIINLALNIAGSFRSPGEGFFELSVINILLIISAFSCAASVSFLIYIIIAICNAVISQTENDK